MDYIIDDVKNYLSYFFKEADATAPLLEQLSLSTALNHVDRKTLPGHVTGSAIVIEGDKILMIFHPFFKRWLQPGGHVDAGENPLEAATRELLEETGLSATLHPWHEKNAIPFDIDIHVIPENILKREAAHYHYDFRYLMALNKNISASEQQDHNVDWIPIEKIEEPSLLKVIDKLRNENFRS